MRIIKNPQRTDWDELLQRPLMNVDTLRDTVSSILAEIKAYGDDAVRKYEKQFDKVDLDVLEVSEEEMNEADALVSQELKDALIQAHENIHKFHASQKSESKKVEVCDGVTCWQKNVPIEKVGLYIPGGTAPLFSTVLMLATPARIAGVSKIFKIGGVQAIGAMAYGTQSVPKVYKIFGPGNQYVMAAKQQVSLHDVSIDMPAGPSEVEVLADQAANPEFVAADLLSQAEHGVDSQVLLITDSEELIQRVEEEVNRQLPLLSRRDIAEKSLANSKLILVKDMDEALEMTNKYAPEHLIIETENYMQLADRIVNAGSVFCGPYSPESAGDYASGTNHTLPTNGYAKMYNGVNLDSYNRKITFQELSPQGVKAIGRTVEIMAANEHLDAHKNAMTVRLNSLKEQK